MKYLLLSTLMLGLVGCKSSVSGTASAPKRPTDDEIFRGLRFEGEKRGLRWEVFCVPSYSEHSNHYQAVAEYASVPRGAIYIEDGARDWWEEAGDTPADAAYHLYLKLSTDQTPNESADHKPGYDAASDCSYNTVYDSEHAGKIPCSKESK